MEARTRRRRAQRTPAARRSPRPSRKPKAAAAAAAPAISPTTQAEITRAAPPSPARAASPFPIVVIGASAGGVEAFKRFFEHMPPDSGMAFVLVPHLDPTHKSLMVELLAKETRMRVLEATQGALILPNHVYVIPPNKYLAIKQRRLVLSGLPEASAGGTAIDFALRSLAEDQHENALGIVLSGTGSHGTAGLKEIKLAGGLVLVQDPATAQHDQMPRSALEAGFSVDFVLAPEKMPEALIDYVQHARRPAAATEPTDIGTLDGLKAILALLQTHTKADFRYYRQNMILRRIDRRMALLKLAELSDYIDRLRKDSDEVAALRRDLLIGVTTFFREPEAFGVLAKEVLPALIRQASADAPLRIWIPACATGEEAYSVAILLFEQFRAARKAVHLQVFATDVDQQSLDIARRGVYPESSVVALAAARLRFFTRTEPHRYQIVKQLRDVITFAPQNLITDPPFSRLDLVSCRNVLIYLEPAVQTKVIGLLHFALKPGGYLMLGPAESIGGATDLFEPVSRKWRIYRRTEAARGRPITLPIAPIVGTAAAESFQPVRRSGNRDTELMQRLLLADFAPAAILVNRKFQILSVAGPVVNYLHLPLGALTHDLLAMARESLRGAIRSAGEKALRTGIMVPNVNARVRRNAHYVACHVSVRPIIRSEPKEQLLLIVFEDALGTAARDRHGRASARDARASRQLEQELRTTREDLQRTITELETSNEDLQASNEEIMSINEELQSANEELESSKEELQSLNEELTTVNNQLEDKVRDLDAANNDMGNLTAATDIAIVFLDPELRIRRFTAPAARLLNLLPGDLGRPFEHLASKLVDAALLEDARHVMSTRAPIEREATSSDQRWYLRRILPFTADEAAAGIVITFVDITQRVQAEAEVRRLAAVLRDSGDAIAIMDLEGRITAWNRGAELLYGYSEKQALKMTLAELATPASRDQAIDVVKRAALGEVVAAFETQRRASDGRVLDVWATVTLVRDADAKPSILAMTERDITARKRSEEQIRALNAALEQRVTQRTRELQASEHRTAAILEASSEAIVAIDNSGKIVTFNHAATQVFGYSAEEAIGQNVRLLMPPSERGRHDAYLTRYLKTREPHIIGKTRALSACRKDGALFPIQLTVSEVEELELFVGCIRDMTAARALQEEVLNIAMLEQRRIGQELHDVTQQELTGLGLLAQNLNEKLGQHGAKADAELAGRVASGIAQANLHVRHLAHGLIPVPIDAESLPAALAELAQSTQQSYPLTCRFECPAPVKVPNAGTATHLYRIAQEAVGNAVKHAKADKLSIRLEHRNDKLALEVADNGIGIDLNRRTKDGVGLRLMEYRCSVIGGRFSVQRGEGGGTVVMCAIPSKGSLT